MPGAVGRFPEEIDQVLQPLKSKISSLPKEVRGQRRKLAYFLLLDAMASVHGIELIVKAPRILGTPLQADAIEPLVRHVVEKAIVGAYIATQKKDLVVDRFLKTSAKQFDRSFDVESNHPHSDLPVRELPTYREMGEEACPSLWAIYRKLSWISHPRSALPFSMQLLSSPDPQGYAALRSAKALGWLEEALLELLTAFDNIDTQSIDETGEDERSDYFLSKSEHFVDSGKGEEAARQHPPKL